MSTQYKVAKITTPDGVYFTSRKDDRTVEQIIKASTGCDSDIRVQPAHRSIRRYQDIKGAITVETIFDNLSKDQADAKKKTLIEYTASAGSVENLLNSKISK